MVLEADLSSRSQQVTPGSEALQLLQFLQPLMKTADLCGPGNEDELPVLAANKPFLQNLDEMVRGLAVCLKNIDAPTATFCGLPEDIGSMEICQIDLTPCGEQMNTLVGNIKDLAQGIRAEIGLVRAAITAGHPTVTLPFLPLIESGIDEVTGATAGPREFALRYSPEELQVQLATAAAAKSQGQCERIQEISAATMESFETLCTGGVRRENEQAGRELKRVLEERKIHAEDCESGRVALPLAKRPSELRCADTLVEKLLCSTCTPMSA